MSQQGRVPKAPPPPPPRSPDSPGGGHAGPRGRTPSDAPTAPSGPPLRRDARGGGDASSPSAASVTTPVANTLAALDRLLAPAPGGKPSGSKRTAADHAARPSPFDSSPGSPFFDDAPTVAYRGSADVDAFEVTEEISASRLARITGQLTGVSSARADELTRESQPQFVFSGAAPAVQSGVLPSRDAAQAAQAAQSPRGDTWLPKKCRACDTHYPADFNVCPRDGTPLEVDDTVSNDPLVGRVLADTYQIQRVVGEGGMGRVYEARHLRLRGRRFAIKVLHKEYARQPEVVSRFRREAEASSAIAHPNVIDVFDVGTTNDGQPYLVGEFLEGEELAVVLKRAGKFDAATAVHIARQVCRALAAAHAHGVIHRDMKPENVFVHQKDGTLTAKVIDFGISKTSSNQTHVTRTGVIMGTPSYMAPEQARGEKTDARTDVYAVGALLYHLLTGRKPFESEDAAVILTAVLTEQPLRPRAIDSAIPEALELVVQHAMAKDPTERFQNMRELEAALAPFDAVSSGVMPRLRTKGDGTIVHHDDAGDGHARTMMASLAAAAPEGMVSGPSLDRQVRQARPMIVVLSLLVLFWGIGGFVGAVGGIVRVTRGGELTRTEAVLLASGACLAALTPAIVYLRHVLKNVWPNTVKALELAGDLRRTAQASLATYGAFALSLRIIDGVILQRSLDIGSGIWDAVLFGLSLIGAIVAGGLGPLGRFARRRANR